MRPVLLFLVPWLVGLLLSLGMILVERTLSARRALPTEDVALPMKPPSLPLFVVFTLFFGPLTVPVYFWLSRRSLGSVLVGIGGAALVTVAVAGAFSLDERIVAHRELRDTLARCESSSEHVPSGCFYAAEALQTGELCVNRAIDPDECPGAFAIHPERDPARAIRIHTSMCIAHGEVRSCKSLAKLDGVTTEDRVAAAAKLAALCAGAFASPHCTP